ncbi:DHH family phosphoesterase [Candidatus Micrarchaeota archaeon]|nr:DHH family phosphoesterase [Candidatus Micrarchaeota archaeon]
MDAEKFAKALKGLKGPTLVTFHSLGDIDAVGGAFALKTLIPNSEVRASGGVGAGARRLLEKLHIPLPKQMSKSDFSRFGSIVLVDVGNPDLLGEFGGEFKGFAGTLAVVDHHYHSNNLKAGHSLIERDASSSCEIVHELLEAAGVEIGENEALLLLAGILADSAFFKSARKRTFHSFSRLLQKTSLDYPSILDLAMPRRDVSEKIARLRCVQSAKFERAGEFVVGHSLSSAFELSCASALVECGCDAAFVANPKEGRMSGAKRSALRGVNVGKLMETAGRAMGGSGGGHENVGGARGRKEAVQKALERIVKLAVRKLKMGT